MPKKQIKYFQMSLVIIDNLLMVLLIIFNVIKLRILFTLS